MITNDLSAYRKVRDCMRTGDGLGFASNSLIGKAIMWRTKGDGPIPHSHWGGIVRLQEYEGLERRRFTLEAMSIGFYPDILSAYIQHYDGRIWWYPLKDSWDCMRGTIGERAMALIGTRYDWLDVGRQMLGRVSSDARRLFCSEAWQLIYGFQGQGLTPTGMHRLGIFETPVRIL